MKNNTSEGLRQRYTEASRKVKELRIFYAHCALFIPGCILMGIGAPFVVNILESRGFTDPEALRWLRLNLLMLPIIWLAVLSVHGMVVYWHRLGPKVKGYKPGFLKRWEARQIRQIMEDSNKDEA